MRKIYTITACIIFLIISPSNVFSQSPPKQPFLEKEEMTCSREHHSKELKTTNKKTPPGKSYFSSDPLGKTLKATCPSSLSAWASYGGSSLVQQLKAATDYDACLRALFSYDSYYGPIVFSNSNIQAVAQEMYNISISHDGTLNSGMLGLVTYLHAATYHEFFQAAITLDATSKYRYNLAAESFANNAHLWELTDPALMILDEYLVMCDYDGLRHQSVILYTVKEVMRKMVTQDNWKQIASNDQLLLKYATAYNRIFYLMFRGLQPVDVNYESAVNADSEFISLLSQVGQDNELYANSTLAFMVDNAVGELSRMATQSTVLRPKAEPYLAQVANKYPRMTPNWYRAVDAINQGTNCASYNLCEDMNALRTEAENNLFPNTWTFDDGKLVVRTPLSYDVAQPLYYAAKQVQAQVFRFLQTDNPMPNDPNATLYMKVYGTLSEYQEWQNLLYGLATNNGGMYIERDATFYTYERTPMESTFTLEELFRHEYVHYLQGRYMETGFWGETPFYQNSRLTWFEEGMAEHFAGSTDTDGVKIRESQGYAIKNDGAASYMTAYQVMSSTYDDGFKFYRYSNMLWAYWFKYDMATARELVNYVKADDITGFDNRVNQLKSSSSLQTSYTNFLNNEVIVDANWWYPVTPWQNDNLMTVGNASDIQAEFTSITGTSATAALDASSMIRRFSLTGTLSGSNFETSLNNLMNQLKNDQYINNFDYITGYYKNVSGSSATFVITGPLRNASVGDAVVADFTAEPLATIEGGNIQFTNQSTGYVKGYSWNFSGGTPSSSTQANPSVIYNTAGTYPASLTVTGNNNSTNTKTKSNYIKVYAKSNQTYCAATVDYNYTYLYRVAIANLDNVSIGFPTNGYSDFTSLIAELSKGQSYTLTVEPEIGGWDQNNIKVWIDWNRNGVFTDAGEEVLASAGLTHTANVTPPSNALEGVTRMRVRYAYGSAPQPCGVDTYMGEVEDYSVVVLGSGGDDTQAPTVPTGLASSNVTQNSVQLSWNTSTDNVGVSGYDIFRNGTQVGTSSSTNYTVNGLSAGTTYSFTVRARDAAGNTSAQSNAISVTTQSDSDTQAPSVPTGLSASSVTQTSVQLNWNASTDNVGVTGYDVFRNGTQVASSTSTSYTVTGLSASTTYSFTVRAKDAAGNNSAQSSAISVTTQGNTVVYCTSQGNSSTYEWIASVQIGNFNNTSGATGYTDFTNQIISLNAGANSVTLTPAFSGSSYTEYWSIWIDFNSNGSFTDAGEQVFTGNGTSTVNGSINIPSGSSGTTRMRVTMKYNAAPTSCEAFSYGEVEDYTVDFGGTNDTQAPTVPTGLSSSNVTQTSLQLSWNASTDNVGVTGYDIFRNGTQVASATSTSYTVTGLAAATPYNFTVRAKDAAGNTSAQSNAISITTQSGSDTQSPTVPTGLTASNVTQTSVSLSWDTSTDNVGVTGYDVFRNGTQIASSTSTNYTVTGLTANTNYSFTVRAKDAAGNTSAQSSAISVTTQSGSDTQAPTAPTNLSASNVTQTSVSLSWTASTDNVGVSQYLVYMNSGNIGTSVSTSYNVTGLTANTSYTFNVYARDAAGNYSPASNTISVTTTGNTVTYCNSQGNDFTYEWIAGVQIGSFSNSSAAAGYTDFTSQTVNLNTGSNSVTLTPGFSSSAYAEYWSIWIDVNKNGSFDDAGEQVFTGNGSSTVSGSMTIPSGVSGTTRMRVSMKYNVAPTSCETFTYGEVEDYTVSFAAVGPTIPAVKITETEAMVFPNPNSGAFKLSYTSEEMGKLVVNIISMNGQLVEQSKVEKVFETIEIEFNLTDMTPGMYNLQIISGESVINKRIVIK